MFFLYFHSLLLKGQKLKDQKKLSALWKAKASGHIVLVRETELICMHILNGAKLRMRQLPFPPAHFQNRNCINRERK